MKNIQFFAIVALLIATLFSANNISAQWSQSTTAIYPTSLTKNVGIGTSNPVARLHVMGGSIEVGPMDAAVEGGEIQLDGAGANPAWIVDVANDRYRVHTGGKEKFTVTSTGKTFVGDDTDSGTSLSLGFGGFGSGEGIGSKRTPGGNLFGLDFYTSSIPRMTITNAGNVGIGTTAPAARLQVYGNASVNNALVNFSDGDGRRIVFVPKLGNGGYNNLSSANDAGIFWSDNNNLNTSAGLVLAPHSNSSAGIRINPNGNIGIGTSNAAYKLTVQTATNTLGIVHTDGNIKLATYVGGAGNGGYLGTQSNHALHFYTNSGSAQMSLLTSGKVGIGITEPELMPGNYKLYVADGIMTEKVKVALKNTGDWADYVFTDDYKLRDLKEVEAFVKENKHLPGVPSAEEVHKTGIDLAYMDAKLLEKIEELTLYVIGIQKENESLRKEIEAIKQDKN